jgi:CheY-like chemotaxis protein
LRLLFADGNADVADSLAMLAIVWGYDARVAYTGPCALELARRYRPDVVVAGLWLPGLDGYALAQQLQVDLAGTTLIALTGHGQPEDRARTREAGFTHHLLKPVEPKDLHLLLTEAAERKHAATR